MAPHLERDVQLQRRYYAQTAGAYDAMHAQDREHSVALAMLVGMFDVVGVGSVLDVGSGTGRALRYLKSTRPDLVVKGIEPVAELRRAAYAQGIAAEDLI